MIKLIITAPSAYNIVGTSVSEHKTIFFGLLFSTVTSWIFHYDMHIKAKGGLQTTDGETA